MAVVAALCIPASRNQAQNPSWWAKFDITSSSAADDYAVINQGQLKNLAYGAYQHLEDSTPYVSGASSGVESALSGWLNLSTGTPTPGSNADDYATVNVGQMKGLAEPFYEQLIEIGYTDAYPWTSSTSDDDNYATVNIGQAKHIFSFDLLRDLNGNEVPDWIEHVADPGHPLNSDLDSDGLTDQEEMALGTDQGIANSVIADATTVNLMILNPNG